jgi:hypothetical protein
VATLLAPEDAQRRPRGVVGAEVVDVHQLLHLVRRDLVDRAVDAEAGVAHHDVEAAEALHGGGDQGIHVRLARHIRHDRQRLAAGARDFFGHFVEPIRTPGAKYQGCPVAREPHSRRAADAGRGARNGHDGLHPFSLTIARTTKPTFAGRSPSRRMKYGNHCRPNGM